MQQRKARIQDDLYAYVNREWIDGATIPDDKPSAGGFSELAKQVEELLISDFKKLNAGGSEEIGESLKRAVGLFALASDVKRRNREGFKPVLPALKTIEKLKDISAFNRKLKELVLCGIPLPFALEVMPDMKNTQRHAAVLSGPSAILPDANYYKPGMEAQKNALLGVWRSTALALLEHAPLTAEEAETYVGDAIAFDGLVAALIKSNEEWSDYPATYNPFKTIKVAALIKPVKLKKLLCDLYGENAPDTLIVAEPRYFKAFKGVFNEQTFTLYKHWAYVKTCFDASPLLSEQLRETGSVYARTLSGVASVASVEKQAYQLASSLYPQTVGLYYGKKYFGERAKRDVTEMVTEIINTYKRRVENNDFLSPETKEKAVLKLSRIAVKMGYPDSEGELPALLVFDGKDSLYAAVNRLKRIKTEYLLNKLLKPVDRTDWGMPAHMVNACYNPFTNDITFPAAILQAPFYSVEQSRSKNLGGIGAVIGHEISHAFDNNGANCDENGNLNNWWTKEDFRKFKSKTKAMIREFEGIELPWGKVNSAFTVSENIADNGGMAVTLDIMGNMPDADYAEYFINWAKVWCMKAREEYLKLLLQVDVHAPAVLRANMQPRNFDEWYKTFGVKKTDKMYISPSKRVVIW